LSETEVPRRIRPAPYLKEGFFCLKVVFRVVVFPREILNGLRWRPGESLEDALITYVHRGAPGDERTISGAGIVELERSFFVTGEAKIPYHRIKRIAYRGKVVFQLEEESGKRKEREMV